MKLTIQQFYDIKFILSGKSKSDIAKEIGVANSNQFSSLDRYKSLCEKLDVYFNELNPEINIIVTKITKGVPVEFDFASEPANAYNGTPKAEIDKLRFELAVEKKMGENYEKRWQEYQIERDGLLKRIWDLGGDREKFGSAKLG